MAKDHSLASPPDVPGSGQRHISHWRSGFKTAVSIFCGAVRDAGLGGIPKSAKAYYVGVSDLGDADLNHERRAHLSEVEASVKVQAPEYSSDGSARLLV